ncbi:MAG: hypothetical protein LBI88_00115 [Deltaproteobacteria bacterium]|jgi:hypothetical protein|nr:hypothetical protein [Deltaproteobacteria bacterium]
MVPDKTRRKKRVLGVLGRILAIKTKRKGKTLGNVAMSADTDRKLLWRMRRVAADDKEKTSVQK